MQNAPLPSLTLCIDHPSDGRSGATGHVFAKLNVNSVGVNTKVPKKKSC